MSTKIVKSMSGHKDNFERESSDETPMDDLLVGEDQFRIIDKDIIVSEYSPDVFAHMRYIDGYNIESLKKSLDPAIEKNIEAIRKAGEGMGKSGSFFFFSHDNEFLIKTMT